MHMLVARRRRRRSRHRSVFGEPTLEVCARRMLGALDHYHASGGRSLAWWDSFERWRRLVELRLALAEVALADVPEQASGLAATL